MKRKFKAFIKNNFPRRVLDFLNRTPDGPYQRISYSISGEDILISNIFRHQHQGCYVDVGAFHPFKYSNTYLLYQKGWRGINIDPTPGVKELFDLYRPNDINLECAVGNQKTIVDFFLYQGGPYNSLNRHSGQEYEKILENQIKVNVKPLNEILSENHKKENQIDLLNIDTEGKDLEVLYSNDWNKFRPRYIIVEDLNFDCENPDSSPINSYLLSLNYKLHSVCHKSLLFQSELH